MAARNSAAFIFAFSVCASTAAYADELDTMVLLEDGATPEDIVQTIVLPDTARDNLMRGHENANEAKLNGREFGQGVAEEAKLRSQGEDIRADVRDNARRDAGADNGLGDDRPGGRPD